MTKSSIQNGCTFFLNLSKYYTHLSIFSENPYNVLCTDKSIPHIFTYNPRSTSFKVKISACMPKFCKLYMATYFCYCKVCHSLLLYLQLCILIQQLILIYRNKFCCCRETPLLPRYDIYHCITFGMDCHLFK